MGPREELEVAAANVISFLRGIEEYSDTKIAVIGGLALWRYMPEGRTTEDVDFIVSIRNAPHAVKQKLLSLPNSPFVQQAQFFYYRTPGGTNVQIDITPELQSPYMPTAAIKLKDLPAGVIPWISEIDLIVFKINSCGLRAQLLKKRTDAVDAQRLLENVASHAPLNLTPIQRDIVEPCIQDVVAHGTKDETWWRQSLGLPIGRRH